MSNKAPAFQLYAQDFLTGVMDLTMEERGVYITLLCKQWSINGKTFHFVVNFFKSHYNF